MFHGELLNYQKLKFRGKTTVWKTGSLSNLPQPQTPEKSRERKKSILSSGKISLKQITVDNSFFFSPVPLGSRTTTWCDSSVKPAPSSWAPLPWRSLGWRPWGAVVPQWDRHNRRGKRRWSPVVVKHEFSSKFPLIDYWILLILMIFPAIRCHKPPFVGHVQLPWLEGG